MRSIIDSASETSTVIGAEHVLADVANGEMPIPLTQLPRHPSVPTKNGRRPHVSACFRWASRGLAGHRLETAKVFGVISTTASAIGRFNARLNGITIHTNTRTPRRRQRDVERAERELESAGL